MRDDTLEIWLRLLALHVREPNRDEDLPLRIRDRWLNASKGYYMGCVPAYLDEAVATQEGKQLVLDAIDSLMNCLAQAPNELEWYFLNLLGFADRPSTIQSSQLIEVAHAFRGLIEGKIKSTAKDTYFMPGCIPRQYRKPAD